MNGFHNGIETLSVMRISNIYNHWNFIQISWIVLVLTLGFTFVKSKFWQREFQAKIDFRRCVANLLHLDLQTRGEGDTIKPECVDGAVGEFDNWCIWSCYLLFSWWWWVLSQNTYSYMKLMTYQANREVEQALKARDEPKPRVKARNPQRKGTDLSRWFKSTGTTVLKEISTMARQSTNFIYLDNISSLLFLHSINSNQSVIKSNASKQHTYWCIHWQGSSISSWFLPSRQRGWGDLGSWRGTHRTNRGRKLIKAEGGSRVHTPTGSNCLKARNPNQLWKPLTNKGRGLIKADDFKKVGTTVPNDVFIDRKEGQTTPDLNPLMGPTALFKISLLKDPLAK